MSTEDRATDRAVDRTPSESADGSPRLAAVRTKFQVFAALTVLTGPVEPAGGDRGDPARGNRLWRDGAAAQGIRTRHRRRLRRRQRIPQTRQGYSPYAGRARSGRSGVRGQSREKEGPPVFVFFSNRLGCLGSLLVSVIGTVIVIVILTLVL
jgi:hypothetical protein